MEARFGDVLHFPETQDDAPDSLVHSEEGAVDKQRKAQEQSAATADAGFRSAFGGIARNAFFIFSEMALDTALHSLIFLFPVHGLTLSP